MKTVGALCAAILLSGCSAIESVSFDGQATRDPSKVYLSGYEQVNTTKRDVEQYACLSDRPLVCVGHGMNMECRCPY